MTHDFTTLTSVLSRCSVKVAAQVIAEISTASPSSPYSTAAQSHTDLADFFGADGHANIHR